MHWFRSNLHFGIVILTIPVVMAAIGVGQTATTSAAEPSAIARDSGELFRKADEAQLSATSYRVAMAWESQGKHMKIIQEVACPNRKRTRLIQNGKTVSDIYEIEGVRYDRARRYRSPFSVPTIVSGCAGGASDWIGGSFNLEDTMGLFRRAKRTGNPKLIKIASSDEKDPAGCDSWEVEPEPWDTVQDDITLCISPENGLPSRIIIESPAGRTVVTYSDWNSKQIVVDPPK